ncbi:uncharacterized protein [Antedon mediterranea]|uniref:uncharacterized protein n=1 Tax=Antedon mediterranea TaxID=105859 RepID=UPI003AF78646
MLKHLVLWTLLLCCLFGKLNTRILFCCQDGHWIYHNTSVPCNLLTDGAKSSYSQMIKWAENQYPADDIAKVFNKSMLNFMINEQLWAEVEKSEDIDVEMFWMGMKLKPEDLENFHQISSAGTPLSSFFRDRLLNRQANDQVCIDTTYASNTSATYSKVCWDAYMEVLSTKTVECTNQWSNWTECIDGERSRERACAVVEPGCIVFPEKITGDCEILDLIFPENYTIRAFAGESLRIQFVNEISSLPVMFQFVNGPSLSSITTNGKFIWTVPNDNYIGENMYIQVLLYNTEGHQRTINLTLEIINCLCEPFGICTQPANQKQGLGLFTCNCQEGRFGTLCENDINECESHPCYPLVDCINLPNMYWCTQCPEGYTGDGITCTADDGDKNKATESTNTGSISRPSKPQTCNTGGSEIIKSMHIINMIAISIGIIVL